MTTTAKVCVSQNLVIGDDGKLRMAPWSVPRNVVDEIALSGGDTTKLLARQTLPGIKMLDKRQSWLNDSPVDHSIRIQVTRRYRRWVTSNPNAVQFRDKWSYAVDTDPVEPIVTGSFNSQCGSAGDVGTNTVAEPNPGKFWHWWGSTSVDEWPVVLKPGERFNLWYQAYVWTPPPFSNNANKNAPGHEAELGWVRLALHVFPELGTLVSQ